jgi:hypothetical protein
MRRIVRIVAIALGVQRLPVVVGEYQGERYLISMLGPESQWVKNVGAAGGAAKLISGRAEPVRLVDVPVDERAPIIKAYLSRAVGRAAAHPPPARRSRPGLRTDRGQLPRLSHRQREQRP